MKIVTVLGTRPEIIRLCRIIPILDELCDHIVVHTGQNYEISLSRVFFDELGLREPNYLLETKSETFSEQVGKILSGCEEILRKEKPDKFLVLGDTNSALSTIVAKRLGIKVYHLEAGNRCYDDRVPEEVNRRIVDHCSDVLMPYTERSRANLLREGISGNRIFVTGNPIYEVLESFQDRIEGSTILTRLGLEPQKYFLMTLHRAENVDEENRLSSFIKVFHDLTTTYGFPIICSLHPRTRSQLEKQKKAFNAKEVVAIDPVGLFDFVKLEKNAFCVLTDSGTVQEECSIYRIPNVTLRDTTERPETVEVGSNIITGCGSDDVIRGVKAAVNQGTDWNAPPEYTVNNVSRTVVKVLLGFHYDSEA